MSVHDPDNVDVILVFFGLYSLNRLPSQLIGIVLEWAGYSASLRKTCSDHTSGSNNENRTHMTYNMKYIPYFTPIRFSINVESKDQGWSSYPEQHGTRTSNAWCELGLSFTNQRFPVCRNIHAGRDWELQVKEFDNDSEVMKLIQIYKNLMESNHQYRVICFSSELDAHRSCQIIPPAGHTIHILAALCGSLDITPTVTTHINKTEDGIYSLNSEFYQHFSGSSSGEIKRIHIFYINIPITTETSGSNNNTDNQSDPILQGIRNNNESYEQDNIQLQLWSRSQYPGWRNQIKLAIMSIEWSLHNCDELVEYRVELKKRVKPVNDMPNSNLKFMDSVSNIFSYLNMK
mmetsp:Transcript_33400/g.34032  ORF Transcript_33400/g.34032 Transcript_33400/m.34032 type:complete len:346 (+) Transcript_33400:105-1142(+)